MRTTPIRTVTALAVLVLSLSSYFFVAAHQVGAAEPSVGLGDASSFVVLAGTTVTNTGPTQISGDLGVSPGTAVTGFPPGEASEGSIHSADAEAASARAALLTAWNSAAGRASDETITADLAGQRLTGGVYTGGALALNGTLTLDAENVADTVWIFQAASTLITGSDSRVSLVNGANPCNVFWQVGSSATLGTDTTFVGTVMALASVTANTGATVEGRLLAHDGAVTLDDNVISAPDCSVAATTTTTPPDTTTTTVGVTTTTEAVTTTTDAATTTTEVSTPTTGGATTTTTAAATTTTEAGPTPTTATPTTTTAAPPTTTPAATSTTLAAPSTPTTSAATTTTVGGLSETGTATTTSTVGGAPEVPADTTRRSAPNVPVASAAPTGSTPSGTPAAPGVPSLLRTPNAPGTPATPVRPDLPRTGSGTPATAATGIAMLLLGVVLVRFTRQPTAR